jgi:hypothetical protein
MNYIEQIWNDPHTDNFEFQVLNSPLTFNVSTTYNRSGELFFNEDGILDGPHEGQNCGVFMFSPPDLPDNVLGPILRTFDEFVNYIYENNLTDITEVRWQHSYDMRDDPPPPLPSTYSEYLNNIRNSSLRLLPCRTKNCRRRMLFGSGFSQEILYLRKLF